MATITPRAKANFAKGTHETTAKRLGGAHQGVRVNFDASELDDAADVEVYAYISLDNGVSWGWVGPAKPKRMGAVIDGSAEWPFPAMKIGNVSVPYSISNPMVKSVLVNKGNAPARISVDDPVGVSQ